MFLKRLPTGLLFILLYIFQMCFVVHPPELLLRINQRFSVVYFSQHNIVVVNRKENNTLTLFSMSEVLIRFNPTSESIARLISRHMSNNYRINCISSQDFLYHLL